MAVGPYARQLMASRCLRIVEAGALEIKMIPVLASFYPHPMLDIEKWDNRGRATLCSYCTISRVMTQHSVMILVALVVARRFLSAVNTSCDWND